MIAGPTHSRPMPPGIGGASAGASSSFRIACSALVRLPPPYSFGHDAPTKPAARRSCCQRLRCAGSCALVGRHVAREPVAYPGAEGVFLPDGRSGPWRAFYAVSRARRRDVPHMVRA